MSAIHKTILFFLLVLTSGYIVSKSMLIVPGKSVGTITINQTTKQEIQKQFGKGKMISEPVGFCGMSHSYKTWLLVLDKAGLVLSFKKDKPKADDTVNVIRIYKNCDCSTDDDMRVGQTTRAAIYKSYGPKPAGASQYKLSYNNKGVGFEFENSQPGKESDTDTLTAIILFEPRTN